MDLWKAISSPSRNSSNRKKPKSRENCSVQVFGPTNLVAGIKLQVRAEDEQAAREILASYSGGNAEAAPETKFEK